jgi:hypothetical protein
LKGYLVHQQKLEDEEELTTAQERGHDIPKCKHHEDGKDI